jgi:hypothetical protein
MATRRDLGSVAGKGLVGWYFRIRANGWTCVRVLGSVAMKEVTGEGIENRLYAGGCVAGSARP